MGDAFSDCVFVLVSFLCCSMDCHAIQLIIVILFNKPSPCCQ